MHILKLNRTGKFALNVVDNLVVVHHQDTEVKSDVGSGRRRRHHHRLCGAFL